MIGRCIDGADAHPVRRSTAPTGERHGTIVVPDHEAACPRSETCVDRSLGAATRSTLGNGLGRKRADPLDEELTISFDGGSRMPSDALRGAQLGEAVDEVRHPPPWRQPGPGRPALREGVDLRNGTGHAGKLGSLSCERVRERHERIVIARSTDHEVVRRRLQRGSHDLASAVLDQPEAEFAVDGRMLVERAGDSQDEVVPRLILEKE